MSRVIVAATQMACTSDRDENIATADGLVKELEVVLPVSFFEKKKAGENSGVTFYGSSFIAGSTGQLLAEADRSTESVITAELDLENIKADRSAWGFFRDRRPEMYRALMTLDGVFSHNDK